MSTSPFSRSGIRLTGVVLSRGVNSVARSPFRAPVLLATVAIAMLALTGASALAALPAPGFRLESYAAPSVFSAADNERCLATLETTRICDSYQVSAVNAGAAHSDGSTVTLSDLVPAGLSVAQVRFFWTGIGRGTTDIATLCSQAPSGEATQVECQLPTGERELPPVAPDDKLEMVVYVTVSDPTPRPLSNAVSISGGGAAPVSSVGANSVSSVPASFGVSDFNFSSVGVDGANDRQAGDHPYELSVVVALNNAFRHPPDFPGAIAADSAQDVKDIVVDLPLGFVGSILASPQCTLAQLSSEQRCPPDTKVGEIRSESVNSDIWNLAPERGLPAEFGFIDSLKSSHVLYTHVIPTEAGYILQTTSPDIPEVSLGHIVATFYGNPAERDGTGNAQIPFFTNPTICSAASMTATVHVDSWVDPGRMNPDGTPDLSDPAWKSRSSVSPPPIGCNTLSFTPELFARPTTETADSPSGMNVEMKLPQPELAGTHATSPLKNASVTFPEGFTLNPASGDGLAACSEAQIGWVGPSAFNFNQTPPSCPEASKVGSLELETPLIGGVLTGQIYIAAQNENPFHSVFGLYVVVNDPVTGVLIKIAGRAVTDPVTGRVTGTFDENPQLPFSDLKLHFSSGPRAVFATPESCGTATTTSSLEPWSIEGAELPVTPFDSFQVTGGCVNGFTPTFTGGSMNLQAGAYSPFVASFSRSDTDQEMGGLSVSLPPGLLANVGSVPLCSDVQATAGTCPEATQVGTVKAGAGPGPNPLFVTGKAYLTGPYKGAPYGLSVVVPAIAGPFNFGNVVVRQALYIDSNDAHATDVSDPFPTILRPTGQDGQTVGIPIRLRRIDVSIDRPGFTFNPTSCSMLRVGGSLTSTQGATSILATPFQVTNCATLKFAPKFAVSTNGKTSKANGASLTVKLAYPNAPQGSQANIARVKVDLPKQLPSRLTTLQKACTAGQFNTNPAGCPAASIIGHAVVHTPILPLPLTGPAIFVSHGGEAFPSLIMVLQGNGVTLDLVGSTFISKTGITSSTFKTVPDAPVGTFELTLPQGKFSALAANGNLCASTLAMPTEFLAQNGAKINESTPVSVTGCAKKKALTRAQKLAAALKACKKQSKAKRAACQASAHRSYGPSARKKSKGKAGRKG
jgi:hypothetical protein